MSAPRIGVLFVGALHDDGFNQSGLAGLELAAIRHDLKPEIITGIPYDPVLVRNAVAAAAENNDGLIFVGGQVQEAARALAPAFPDRRFIVVQGTVHDANLASFEVLQEQSAFLAGLLAARMTKTGVVGHLSGHRVPPGLRGRAAFAAGVQHAGTDARLVTCFCGTQDDPEIAADAMRREISAGADIVFTMLNAARPGAIAACREAGIRQIGNIHDWTARDPHIFAASAGCDIGYAVSAAFDALVSDAPLPAVRRFGLETPQAVGIHLAHDVPEDVREDLALIAGEIAAGRLAVPVTWEGEELA